jgi:hypothetical protein
MRKTLEGRSPLCIVGNKLCFATRSGNNICVHENSNASSFKELGQIQVGGLDYEITKICDLSLRQNVSV